MLDSSCRQLVGFGGPFSAVWAVHWKHWSLEPLEHHNCCMQSVSPDNLLGAASVSHGRGLEVGRLGL